MSRSEILKRVLVKEVLRQAFIDEDLFIGQGGENVHGEFGEVPDWHTRLAEFKTKWGSEPRQLVRYYYPASSESIKEQSSGYIYRFAEAVWQRLPLKTTAMLGDWIYEHL